MLKATGDLGPQRANVVRFYEKTFLPDLEKYEPLSKPRADYFPQLDAAYLLQDRYVVRQPTVASQAAGNRVRAMTDAYDRVHAKYDEPIHKLASQSIRL